MRAQLELEVPSRIKGREVLIEDQLALQVSRKVQIDRLVGLDNQVLWDKRVQLDCQVLGSQALDQSRSLRLENHLEGSSIHTMQMKLDRSSASS